jgi:spermidine/putrescine transport system permease protein
MNFAGFTFYWYKILFSDKEILGSVLNTLIVAVVSSSIATILGTFAIIGVQNLKKIPKKILINIANIPLINPEVITGVSLMLLFVFINQNFKILGQGLFTLILSHTTFCIPYVILSIAPKISELNPNVYSAALDLGASPAYSFLKVILKEILPGIITGFILAFTVSIDDFVISYFTGGSVQTLSVAIYSMSRKVVSPEINALSSVLFFLVFILLIIINLRENKKVFKTGEI